MLSVKRLVTDYFFDDLNWDRRVTIIEDGFKISFLFYT